MAVGQTKWPRPNTPAGFAMSLSPESDMILISDPNWCSASPAVPSAVGALLEHAERAQTGHNT
jgi:hypothetical protein